MATAQLIPIVGALLNMAAFALLHFEIAPSSALRYLIPNWLGLVLLVMSAYVDRQWAFLVLEGRLDRRYRIRDRGEGQPAPVAHQHALIFCPRCVRYSLSELDGSE